MTAIKGPEMSPIGHSALWVQVQGCFGLLGAQVELARNMQHIYQILKVNAQSPLLSSAPEHKPRGNKPSQELVR
jgi:hypothetical protein